MSRVLAIRTHSLDNKSETKTVGGFVIETGIPIPPRRTKATSPLLDALTALEVGESLVHTHNAKDQRARVNREYKGRKYESRPLNAQKTKWRIWRTK